MIIRKKRKKKARSRIDPKIPVIIFALLLAIGAVLFLVLHNGTEETAEFGSMMFSMKDKSAVIIRDEHTYIASEHTDTDFLKEEGASVNSGDKLATVYKLGYSGELMQSLLDAREDVYRAQMERIGATKDQKLDEINERLSAVKSRITSCVMLDSGEDLEKLYRSLDDILKERMEYLRGKVQETENLRGLYAQVDAKEDLISAWTEDVTAESPGVVSFYFDSYEQALNAEKLNMISADLVTRAIKGKGAANWTTDDKTRVCRVVDPDKWYLAFITDGSGLKRLAAGVEYEVSIKGHGTFRGVGLEPVVSGKEIVNIIEFSTDMGSLIDVRTVRTDITAAVTGVRVKSGAVTFEESQPYIELVLTNSHHSIRVDVLASEDGYAIVRPHESGESLSEGARYWNRKR
ncbi:MAG: hypothetical protein IKP26_04925 [Clostridia bacterium]|nr:hypothetical protein [Clostridia bacterium]MBR6108975.1 hypothetical protein [Clostridia bacterium]